MKSSSTLSAVDEVERYAGRVLNLRNRSSVDSACRHELLRIAKLKVGEKSYGNMRQSGRFGGSGGVLWLAGYRWLWWHLHSQRGDQCSESSLGHTASPPYPALTLFSSFSASPFLLPTTLTSQQAQLGPRGELTLECAWPSTLPVDSLLPETEPHISSPSHLHLSQTVFREKIHPIHVAEEIRASPADMGMWVSVPSKQHPAVNN